MSPHARRVTVAVVPAIVAVIGVGAFLVLTRAPDARSANGGSSSASAASTEPSSPAAAAPGGSPSPTRSSASDPAAAPRPTGTTAPNSVSVAPVQVTVAFSGFDASAGAARLGGYADVLEAQGTCTLTMTLRSRTATRSSGATPDATTMSCGDLEIPRTELIAGSWLAVLRYTSTDRAGVAPAVTIEVP